MHPAVPVSVAWPVSCKLFHAQHNGRCSPADVGVRQVTTCGLIGVGQGQHWGLCNDSAVCEVSCRGDVAEQVELDVFPLIQKAKSAKH